MANRGQSFVVSISSLSEFLKNRLKIAILKFSIISDGEVGVGEGEGRLVVPLANTTGQTWLIVLTVVCGFVGR